MSALQSAFASNPVLLQRVRHAASDPNLALLFDDISHHILDLQRRLEAALNTDASEPASKKRKLADTTNAITNVPNGSSASQNNGTLWAQLPLLVVAQDISIIVPIRKKLRIDMNGNGRGDGGITGTNISGEKEIAVAWRDVDQIISVPVPEKAQPAYHFVILPTAESTSSITKEAVVFTVPAGAAKGVTFPGGIESTQEEETYDTLLRRIMDQQLSRSGKKVIVPEEKEFASAVIQSHRKGEKGWHVKAWRGSKDGFLYFLPTGILFGFRKPLQFFPFHDIISVSYSSVLQRTFNLNVAASTGESNDDRGGAQEIEFAMIDQVDFAGIDAYIKRHRLNDASLAESRRAKVYNINKNTIKAEDDADQTHSNGNEANTGVDGEQFDDELTRRERQLQDAEDEEEEDYDPSGGSSEGSGEDTDEEAGDEQGAEPGGEEELDEVEEEEGGYEDEDEDNV